MATKLKKVNIAGVRPTEACSDQRQQQNEQVSDNKLTYNRSTLAYWTALDKLQRNKDKPQNCAAIFFLNCQEMNALIKDVGSILDIVIVGEVTLVSHWVHRESSFSA